MPTRTILLLCAAVLLAAPADAEEPAAGAGGNRPQADGRGRLLPQLDYYFPEGELDFRLNGLIKGAFFEGQIRYDFVDGDILAFLRYRYYGYRQVFQLGLFDSVEFEDLEDGSDEFERVRGGLFLLQWPHTLNRRSFFLAEADDITSNKESLRLSTDRTNTFVRLGFQVGTPADDRSNDLIGASPGTRRPLFTARRRIGPYGAGLTAALTWSFNFLGSDFDYLRGEFESLKRFELGDEAVLIARLHGGTFFSAGRLAAPDGAEADGVDAADLLAIPRNELFRLDGRDNLKGVEGERRGTHELHSTVEIFLPWFVGQQRGALGVEWQTWYWILYSGYGAVSFEREALRKGGNYVTDVGFGFESSFRLRDYTFFLSGIVAQALGEGGGVKTRFAIKSYR